ncbi:2,3-bisphosphoglycerate-independent phosphoglycerate mutase [Cobetia marina]|uniref:2,3-bisphosphoglycerate-independent phosphoglycerate mutase n=1 Tax=Cobetia marina TaxID=28258 RepID=UPI002546BBD8|nr:2,3-bisphosphoglycerate-independent phosphoglycerate mutase [Cobetia pacifica]MDI6004523.1 2,3-bisphosphoglycerate-independent phosphoglycerate mutase [Cobetia pacifica]
MAAQAQGPRPVALIILDGYGHSEEEKDNAILAANTPVMDRLRQQYPSDLIHTDGGHVGLPDGQMGNSEVGHMNLGAGRIVYQDFTRITKAVRENALKDNTVLTAPLDAAIAAGRAVHLIGLLSPGGVHSHEDHILAMADLAAERGAKRIYLHAILDGRDTAPKSAEASIARADEHLAGLGLEEGRVATLVGRYFAMDRDNRWDRVEQAYRVIAEGQGLHKAASGVEGLAAAYERDETDEFVSATRIGDAVPMQEGDAALFLNFRADRARELTRAFVEPDFSGFERTPPKLAHDGLVMLTQYAADIPAPAAFPPSDLPNTLGEVVSNRGLTQLRIAETEKYAHVTFFFSGGREDEFEGETRILVPSPQDVKTYDEKPEMSAGEVTDKLVEAIESGRYDLIVCNYANGDMVGHTGKFDAAVKAIEYLDGCVGRVVEALEKVGGECLITADHGNAEQMVHPETGNPQTAHTTFEVPLIYVTQRDVKLASEGRLCDLAPTLLTMMGQAVPEEMDGNVLVDYAGA